MPLSGHGSVFWLGIGYCAAAPALEWLSALGLYRGIGVSPWNPAIGLAVAFAYVYGRQAWAYVLVAELLTAVLLKPTLLSYGAILPLAAASAAIWIASGHALRSLPGFDPRLRTVEALANLFAIGLTAAVARCFLYIGGLWFGGLIQDYSVVPAAWRLIVGDLVGILAVTPLPLLVNLGWRGPRPTWTHVAQLLLLFITLWTVFGYRAATAYQLFYLLFLPVLWVAIRDGTHGAVAVLNLAQVGIIIGAQLRMDLVPSAGALQALMTALSLTGLLVGVVVTERQLAAQRLRDQQAALGRVVRLRSAGETAAAIAHQINQPLTAIATYTSVAQDALARNEMEVVRQTLSKLTNECDRAAAVVRAVRDLVKQGSLTREPLQLHTLVDDLLRAHDAECKLHDIAVAVEIPGTLPTLQADRIQLEQAIDNLLTNSIDAIRESGRSGLVKISARHEKGDTQILVEDNGPGFAAGLDAIATTPFMTTKRHGTGLGLAIARSVAEAHGGSLAVDQRLSGACVSIRLPAVVATPNQETRDVQSNQHH
jgi:signal transduction histidine kinase